jgi:glucose-1-phosphate adenylyltransferase
VQVYLFDGYWKDIGTIKSFYQANLELVSGSTSFDLVSPSAPIYSRPRFLPPTRVDGAAIKNSLIADGSRIEQGAVIENSIIGLRCSIGRDVIIRNSILMGNDFYELPGEADLHKSNGLPPLGVGPGTHIERAIIDKNCRIGRNVRIINEKGLEDTLETQYGMIRDGIVVIPKETTLPDHWAQE